MVFKCIDSIKNTNPCLFKLNSGIEVLMSQSIFDGLKIYLNITSFDYFDYPLLGTPFIKTGIEYNFYKRFSTLIDYTMKFEDMFTSTVYVSGSYLRIGAKVEI